MSHPGVEKYHEMTHFRQDRDSSGGTETREDDLLTLWRVIFEFAEYGGGKASIRCALLFTRATPLMLYTLEGMS